MRPIVRISFSLLVTGAVCLHWLAPKLSAAQEPKRYYLGVSVEKYEHRDLKPLQFCDEDISEMGDLLAEHGYEIKVLSEASAKKDPKLAPTKENIEREIEAFRTKATAADTVVLALAGHGLQFAGQSDAYFCPQEGLPFPDETKTLVSVGHIYRQFEKSKAGTRIILVDSCRNDPDSTRGRGFDATTGPAVPQGVAALFSCAASQQALESEQLKHGVFFHYVLEALRSEGERESTGEVTFDRMQAYVRKNVPPKVADLTNRSKRQSPNLKADISGEPPILLPAPLRKSFKQGDLREDNSVNMKLVFCPPGKFLMGSPSEEKDREDDEGSAADNGGRQVDVTLTRGFWMGQTEVTQKQWFDVMSTKPWLDEKGLAKAHVKEGNHYAASYISHEDAMKFCDLLTEQSRKSGRRMGSGYFTLPTEAQWEYACRAASNSRFCFGNSESQLNEYAWWGGLTGDGSVKEEQHAHEVGLKKPNLWRLYDMHGNCLEWCRDAYQDHLEGGRDPLNTRGELFVLRGGSWNNQMWKLRSAQRSEKEASAREDDTGFRVLWAE